MVVKFNRGGGLVPPPQLCPGFFQKFDKYPKKSHTACYCDSKNCKMKEKKKQIFEHDFKPPPHQTNACAQEGFHWIFFISLTVKRQNYYHWNFRSKKSDNATTGLEMFK